jgi:hypothetical protein
MTATGYWFHLRYMGVAGRGHSHESGNLFPKPSKCAVDELDSRFRGNDPRFERDPIRNDINNPPCACFDARGPRRYNKYEGVCKGG